MRLLSCATLLASLLSMPVYAACWTQGGDYAPCSWPDTGFSIPETGEKVVGWPSPQAEAVYQAFRTLENTPGGPAQLQAIIAALQSQPHRLTRPGAPSTWEGDPIGPNIVSPGPAPNISIPPPSIGDIHGSSGWPGNLRLLPTPGDDSMGGSSVQPLLNGAQIHGMLQPDMLSSGSAAQGG